MECLKRFGVLTVFVFLALPLWAPVSSRLNIEESDGSPSTFPWKLKVTNGSLTDNGDGTASLATGAGSGGGGSSTLAVSSGSAINSVIISSPTSNIVVDSNTFIGSLQGTTTTFLKINPSSVTLQGQGVGVLAATQTWTGGNTFSSATFTLINGVTPSLVAGTNITSITGAWPNQTINATTQGGGSSSVLSVGTGTLSTYVFQASSPTAIVNFDGTTFKATLAGSATAFISLNNSSVTLQGNSVSLSALSSSSTLAGYLASTQTWTGNNTFSTATATSLVVTSSAVIPTNSQNFGRSTLNQWYSQMATIQTSSAPANQNRLSIFLIGDSHLSKNRMTGPFIDWAYSNFGNSGTLFPLSDYSESDDTMRPNGCTYSRDNNWAYLPNLSTSLGFDDDQMHSSTPTATILGTCPGADTVILHYVKQVNGGTITFKVDGGNTMVINSSGTLAVASATISGLAFGVHTASVTVTSTGTVGTDVLDLVFYSTSTPGAVIYRAGTNAQRADMYVAQDATKYQNLLAMLPSTPSVVVVALGVNDQATNISTAAFIANIRTMVGRFRNVYPNIDCVYMSEPDFQNSASDQYPLASYASAMLAASVQDQCGFIDFTTLFSTFPAFTKYYSDTIHLNTAGGSVAGQLLINTFANNAFNVTPYTWNVSSGVVAYGNDQSTNTLSNVAAFGSSIVILSGITNVGGIGTGLNITKSNTFLIGGLPGSGTEGTVSMSGISLSTYGVTGNYTAASTNTVIMANCASNCTITLPTAVGIAGKLYRIKMLNAPSVTVTVATTGGQTIDGSTTQALTLQYAAIDVISDGSNWEIF